MLITCHIFPVVSLIFLNSDRTLLCFYRPTHPTETTLGVLLPFVTPCHPCYPLLPLLPVVTLCYPLLTLLPLVTPVTPC